MSGVQWDGKGSLPADRPASVAETASREDDSDCCIERDGEAGNGYGVEMSQQATATTVWDGLEPQERRCLAMIIDALRGPPEYKRLLNEQYSAGFQLDVLKKRKRILCQEGTT